MEHEKKIIIPIYDYGVTVVVTTDVMKSREARNFEIGHPCEGTAVALHSYCLDKPDSWIFLQKGADSGVIAHECYHCVSRLFRWIGTKKVDEEIFAYTLHWLINQVGKANLEK